MEEVDLTDVQLKPFPEDNQHLCEPPPIPILIVDQPQVFTTLPQLVRCPACSTQVRDIDWIAYSVCLDPRVTCSLTRRK